jgi:hypothetical protein
MTSPTSPLKKRPISSFRVPTITPTALRGDPPGKVPVGVQNNNNSTALHSAKKKNISTALHSAKKKHFHGTSFSKKNAGTRSSTRQPLVEVGPWVAVERGVWGQGGRVYTLLFDHVSQEDRCPTADHLWHSTASCVARAAAVLLLCCCSVAATKASAATDQCDRTTPP